MKIRLLAALLTLLVLVSSALADPGAPTFQSWQPIGRLATPMTATSATSNVALPTGGLSAQVCNQGSVDAYVTLGTSNAVVATTTSGSWLKNGTCTPFNLRPNSTTIYTYIAAITASGSTAIYVEVGLGGVGRGGPGGGGGGGGITQLTGDVAAGPGSGSQAATIQPGVVTLADMANLAALSFVGNAGGSPATPAALSVPQAKTLLAYQASDLSNGVTGSGAIVLATSPTLVTPTLGAATATSINKVALTAPATLATLTILNGKTLTVNKTLTLDGTDSTTMTFPAASDTLAGLATAQTFTKQNTFAVGTITTSQPFTITQTWNAGGVTFTGLLLNATSSASAAGSLLMDLQVAGATKFNVGVGGVGFITELYFESTKAKQGILGDDATNGLTFTALTTGTRVMSLGPNAALVPVLQVPSTAFIAWASGSDTRPSTAADTILARDAANTLALRNGVNAQKLSVYNTFTDASNYERAIIDWAGSSNVLSIGTERAGTGSTRNLRFIVGGSQQLDYGLSIGGAWLFQSDIYLGNSGSYRFVNGSVISGYTVDGNISLTNNARTSFGLLQFGGTSASFPSEKRVAATIAFRLADDSADAAITAAGATLSGQLVVTAMTQSSAAQSGTVCYNSGTGAVNYDATLGCLTSSLRFKHDWRPLSGALSEVMHLEAGRFLYNDPSAAGGGEQIGLNAENMLTVEPDLVGYAPDGQLLGVRYQNTVALLVAAVQEQQREIDGLRHGRTFH